MALSLAEKLNDLLGRDAILSPERLADYTVDGLIPQAVVQPLDRRVIGQVLRWASAERVAVLVRGGGTQLALGNVPNRVDLVLDLGRHNRILDHQPADLTATVETGVTLEVLQQELAKQGQFLPLEAPLAQRATIGGILAANTSGPLRFAYGLAREWLIGISVVSASGVETRAGGKVVKNVTGYDLNKLYTGSLGTLGVIVEATFKLSPLPPDSATLVATFSSVPQAVAAGRALLRQVFAPQALQVIDGLAARRLGIASTVPEGRSVAIAFFSGRARSVQRKLDEANRLLRDSGAAKVEEMRKPSSPDNSAISTGDQAVTPPGQDVRSPLMGSGDSEELPRRLTDLGWTRDTTPHLGLKVNVPPSAVGRVMEWSQGISALGHPPGVIADVGFGMLRLLWWAEGESPLTPHGPKGAGEDVLAVIGQLRELAHELNGSVVVEHCPLPVKQQLDIWGDSPQGIEIMRRIKEQFDPLGILNPGRFVGRI